ncbi:hypothetical protein LDC_0283, partial [sediment metagenome]
MAGHTSPCFALTGQRATVALDSAAMKPAAIEAFFATLKAANPLPNTELEYTSVFELLAAVLLS